MKTKIKQGFTLIELLVVITIIALLASLAMPVYSTVTQRGNITKGINNCRQIITALKVFASDNGGLYPDNTSIGGSATGAASALELLLPVSSSNANGTGILSDDRVFGCPASPFVPNGTNVLTGGHNHWDMVAGLTDSSPASYPVLFENSSAPAWDPTWNTQYVAVAQPGRCWTGPSIIIGLNDSSVSKQALTTQGSCKPLTAGGSFDQFSVNMQTSGATPPNVLGNTN